ncbi:hypothetical protein ABPG75_012604 [Micractinium tetrahymenae]
MSQGGGAGDDSAAQVACSLTLAAAAARPGETVTALLQVSCSQPEALELQEVEIEFTGVERVDTSWVLPTYRRATPPINADKRKVQRYVVQSRLQAATQGTFSDLSLRRFVIRFTLPGWLPPTFRGTAVRYIYYLQAVVKYRSAADSGDTGAFAAAASQPGSAASRVPLHLWPAKQQQLESATLERTPSLLSPAGASLSATAAAAAADGSLLSPPIQSEDVPIKCWEIGPGTAVQDAVAHIVKLASQPAASLGRPTSPGHLPCGGSGRGSGGMLAGNAGNGDAGGDAHSEISHEPEEVEMGSPGGLSAAGAAGVAGAAAAPARLSLPPAAQQQPQQQQQQQADQRQQGPGSASLSSGASTPRSARLLVRRPSLARPSMDHAASLATPRSPSQLLQETGSTLRSFALRIGEQPLVRVTLHPPLEGSLHPGATLAGTLDFSQPAAAAQQAAADGGGGHEAFHGPRCMQVLILLETEEIVEQPWRRPVQGGGAGAIRCVYDEHLELTADTACTHFLFTIPPDASASFQTPLLQLRWLLRFQFTVAAPPSGGDRGGDRGGDWSPLAGRIEQLSWVLPVTVLAPTA